jgi:hypothetical protein
MKKTLLSTFAIIVLLSSGSVIFGQFDVLKKVKKKVEDAGKTTETTGQPNETGSVLKSKATVNNRIGAVLSKGDYKSFDEAEPNAATRVVDGDLLWLYLKFNGTLADHVHKNEYADNDGNISYVLFFDIGAQGETSSYANGSLVFKKDELNVSELKIALAPGRPGRNKSLELFLATVGGGRPGVWQNEIRVSNNPSLSDRNGEYLARIPITCDVSDGLPKYRAMDNEYREIVRKGTVEDNKMPVATAYVNNPVKAQILAKLKTEGIVPAKIFFTTDGWTEYLDSQSNVKQDRKLYAAYLYKKGADCLYGIAEVTQNYSYYTAGYGESNIIFRKDYPIACGQ